MAPPQQAKPAAKTAVTFRTKPGKGEVKVSVLNIRGPFSAEIIRPTNPQMNMPTQSSISVHRPQPSVAASRPASSSTVSKGPPTVTAMLRIGSCLSKDIVSSSTIHRQRLSPGLRPLCSPGVSSSAMSECLIIRSLVLHKHIQKKTPDRPAAQ